MNKALQTGQRGSIKWIILIIIGLVLASYFFDFSVQDAVEDEQTQSNYNYIKTHTLNFYNAYLRQPLSYFWDTIVIDIIWNNFTEYFTSVQNGESTILDQAAKNIGSQNFSN